METPATSGTADRLAGLLIRLARKLTTQAARDLEPLAIGLTQRRLLDLIVAAPGISPATAAGRLAVDKAAVTRAVRRLETNRFVVRRRSDRDRRAWELHPTRLGLLVSRPDEPGAPTVVARLVSGFDAVRLSRLVEDLARLDANLDVTPAEFIWRSVWGPHAPYPDRG